ncbi:baseplate J/gp47 family protein [Achromobacter ruhlandii]|uniref:baseplate J/gp47 family protein n=1 Tax=Achromobacter ruhlandii TaxID=72557 RepID=UPI001EEDAF1E|nr:baseplate J/gp47 family protein [Achromobacter ruhlandii]MCV6800169.1 baseplate J/gp47 family protein [Achromobacter ruhlandii]MCV6805802.1 baseplate J/gp47 family protein [Achromobacter ruhlandii]MCV6812535.1 baseplate J/gp47 family protein [Achromobacter ruhlandii]MCV6820676.1 baseplate J/gp47 family protein [Achromobacter ruhlandii]MCZ8397669.1 baseplate J/gp47 family protein [Achromobacter ruhlandii]
MTILSTAPVIDATGIRAPSYGEVLQYFKEQYRGIYGADTYLEADSQDGQLLAVFALAIHEANTAAINVYNAFSPATATNAALSSNVKINGLARGVATRSSVDLRIVGQSGVTIVDGVATDADRGRWLLPASVTIPPGGEITVTAQSQALGAVTAAAGSINQIGTPTLGWQSVSNPAAATPGAPVESDAALRVRQAVSVALPSRSVLEGTIGAVASVPGVLRHAAYENDTAAADAHGLPPHSIALVVDGGDAALIAQAIAAKKTPGTGTHGTTTVVVTDIYGIAHRIRFFRPTIVPLAVDVQMRALAGYNTATGQAVQRAVADYINGVAIGGGASASVEWADAISAANGVPGNGTFKITGLTLRGPAGNGVPDVPLAFNEAAAATPDDVKLTVT